jgi:hypothetical protein
MNNDRKLLELAAKAAGYKYRVYGPNEPIYIYQDDNVEYVEWNPLANDTDALRLAAKLEINVKWSEVNMAVSSRLSSATTSRLNITPGFFGVTFLHEDELYPSDERGERYLEYIKDNYPETIVDRYMAVRRAIVLAAAEKGRKQR